MHIVRGYKPHYCPTYECFTALVKVWGFVTLAWIRPAALKDNYIKLDSWKGNLRKRPLWNVMARERSKADVAESKLMYGQESWRAPRRATVLTTIRLASMPSGYATSPRLLGLIWRSRQSEEEAWQKVSASLRHHWPLPQAQDEALRQVTSEICDIRRGYLFSSELFIQIAQLLHRLQVFAKEQILQSPFCWRKIGAQTIKVTQSKLFYYCFDCCYYLRIFCQWFICNVSIEKK